MTSCPGLKVTGCLESLVAGIHSLSVFHLGMYGPQVEVWSGL